MLRRTLLVASILAASSLATGDGVIHAASCTPLRQGTCHACKNCRYCNHCGKNGGICSVCK